MQLNFDEIFNRIIDSIEGKPNYNIIFTEIGKKCGSLIETPNCAISQNLSKVCIKIGAVMTLFALIN